MGRREWDPQVLFQPAAAARARPITHGTTWPSLSSSSLQGMVAVSSSPALCRWIDSLQSGSYMVQGSLVALKPGLQPQATALVWPSRADKSSTIILRFQLPKRETGDCEFKVRPGGCEVRPCRSAEKERRRARWKGGHSRILFGRAASIPVGNTKSPHSHSHSHYERDTGTCPSLACCQAGVFVLHSPVASPHGAISAQTTKGSDLAIPLRTSVWKKTESHFQLSLWNRSLSS